MVQMFMSMMGQSVEFLDVVFIVLSYAALILLCLPVHEFAHAFAAHALGDDTAKWHGRLTINPFKHLDLFGTLMLVLCGIGYAKPVPVNPNNFNNRKIGMALTSLAGPLSNLIMAILAVAIFRVICLFSGAELTMQGGQLFVSGTEQFDLINYSYIIFINIFASINLGLAVFNLLPIPPLDGSNIFGAVLPSRFSYTVARYQQYITIALLVLLLTGVLDLPLELLRHGFGFVICFLLGMPNVF